VIFRVKSRSWLGMVAVVAAFHGYADAGENPYTEYTDEELTQLAADWRLLDRTERRDYFTEVRRRMDVSGGKQPSPTLRRFGQIVRQPDGTVVRIEGVLRYERTDDGIDHSEYGTGFDQRAIEEESASDQVGSVPVITVNQP